VCLLGHRCSFYTSLPLLLCEARRTSQSYTLSLHDALPISVAADGEGDRAERADRRRHHQDVHQPEHRRGQRLEEGLHRPAALARSEEHTSELQTREDLVCRLLLEKKKCKASATPKNKTIPR